MNKQVGKNHSGALAQSITRHSSTQTYYTARMMVDRDKMYDFFRAYAYFRWADDFIDVHSKSDEERISFIERQRAIIDGLYRQEEFTDLMIEESMVAELIENDRQDASGLQSFIRNMLAIVEFDAYRRGRLISNAELDWYTNRLGRSVTDGILYFVGNGHPYSSGDSKYLAATAAHITHLLRDMVRDTADGFINIPQEYLELHGIRPDDVNSPAYREWVRDRVHDARTYFSGGKTYLDELEVLRAKVVGHWYCARFEAVLDTIERDDYLLRDTYNERRRISTWLRIGWLGAYVTIRHLARRAAHALRS
jgi:phytoene/squalene synthetase